MMLVHLPLERSILRMCLIFRQQNLTEYGHAELVLSVTCDDGEAQSSR